MSPSLGQLKLKENFCVPQMKEAGSAINLVSTSTDDAEKVFQEAIEQVTKNTPFIREKA